jgi:hypothetical protein
MVFRTAPSARRELDAAKQNKLARKKIMSTATLEMAPMQWANLKDIDEVEPISEQDYGCLAEVREVLKRHGKRDRFGVALLHKHFDLADDEMLVECTNKQERVLTIKPVKAEDAGNTVQTIWMLMDGETKAMMGCRQSCGKDVQGNHNSFHSQT